MTSLFLLLILTKCFGQHVTLLALAVPSPPTSPVAMSTQWAPVHSVGVCHPCCVSAITFSENFIHTPWLKCGSHAGIKIVISKGSRIRKLSCYFLCIVIGCCVLFGCLERYLCINIALGYKIGEDWAGESHDTEWSVSLLSCDSKNNPWPTLYMWPCPGQNALGVTNFG